MNKKNILSVGMIVIFLIMASVPVVYASSGWDNSVYIDDSFKKHLCEGDNPFDSGLFGGRSYKEYDNIVNCIKNGVDTPFNTWISTHDNLNTFDGSVYLYVDDRMVRFGYHCGGEIVLSYDSSNNYRYGLNFLSRQPILYESSSWAGCYPDNLYYPNSHVTEGCSFSTGYTIDKKSIYDDEEYVVNSHYLCPANNFGFWNMPFKVFDTYENAVKYLYTGDETGLMYSPVPKAEYSQELYLENFQMTVHDSNDFDRYYLAFSYNIPNDLELDINSNTLELKIKNRLEWESTMNPFLEWANTWDVLIIDLKENPTGFNLYLDDFNCISRFFEAFGSIGGQINNTGVLDDYAKRQLLGDGSLLEDVSISSEGLSVPLPAISKVTKSFMYIDCYVVQDGYKEGYMYSGNIDFLSGDNAMASYTPNDNGNYDYNGDAKQQGSYYTDVSIDNRGNPVYNYYYVGTDGTRTQVDSSGVTVSTGSVVQNNNVTIPDTINVNVSGGGFSGNNGSNGSLPNITIEDDDMSFSSLADVLKSGFGILDDVDTGVKGDGFPSMLEYLYRGLPAPFSNMILLGVSSVTAIAILLKLIRR